MRKQNEDVVALVKKLSARTDEHDTHLEELDTRAERTERILDDFRVKLRALERLEEGQKKHTAAIDALRNDLRAEVKAREVLGDQMTTQFNEIDERLSGQSKRMEKCEARLDRMQEELRITADQVLVSENTEGGDDDD